MKLPYNIQEYLLKRGISQNIIEDANLMYDLNRISIPVYNKNKDLLFYKYRKDPNNTDESVPKYMYDRGAQSTLYNTHTIVDKSAPVIITEGELDALCLSSHGVQAITSTGGCGSFKEEWAHELDGLDIYICYDRDGPGAMGMLKTQSMLPNAKCIFLPEFDGKDITDFMLQSDRTGFFGLYAENWYIPEPDITKSSQKQIKVYNDIANKALNLSREHPEYEIYTREIIKKALDYKQQLPRLKKRAHHTQFPDKKKAKSVPMTMFLKFNTSGFARCPWHEEKTGSLKYYKDNNSAYCFGQCGRHYDVIDLIIHLKGFTLPEAIDYLSNI